MDQTTEPETQSTNESGPKITHEFFDRARARLDLAVPPGLFDPNVPVTRGDLDLDPSVWERAGVAATKPAASRCPSARTESSRRCARSSTSPIQASPVSIVRSRSE